jgi:hypothetical protein
MKLQRAEEHFGQLQADHTRFTSPERNPYRMLRERDPETDYYIWRAKIVEPPPLEKWGSMAGECIHSLRSALDHTAHALVRINRPSAEVSEFPIFKDRGLWDRDHAKKLPGVDPKVITQVKWLQPYRGGGDQHALWLIHYLDIVDKHRRLNLVSPSITSAQWTVDGGQVEDVDMPFGPFEDGTPVARFKMTPTRDAPPMYVKTEFAFDVAFGEGEPLARLPVLVMLESMRSYAGFVVARFDRFFA